MSAVLDRVVGDFIAEDWSGEPVEDRAERLFAYVEELDERVRTFTPAEQVAHEQALKVREDVRNEYARAELAKDYRVPLLSLEPLRWTQEKKVSGRRRSALVPLLALLPLRAKEVRICSEGYEVRDGAGDWLLHRPTPGEFTVYPELIARLYEPVRASLTAAQSKRSSLTLTWAFQHVIPADVKRTIADIGVAGRFSELYLLAETDASDWKIEEAKFQDEPRAPRFDPLLVGWAYDALWLLDRFDATPLEDYIASEFAVPVERHLAAGK